jgi:bacillithiol system protein YtxJ
MHLWRPFTSISQLEEIRRASFDRPQLIFKHSSRCGISAQAMDRLFDESQLLAAEMDLYFLDLIPYREISQLVSDSFNVRHQSPQVVVVQAGTAFYHASHFSISPTDIVDGVLDHRNKKQERDIRKSGNPGKDQG